MEIHPRRPGASALIDAASNGLLLASSLAGMSESVIAVFSSFISDCSSSFAASSGIYRIIQPCGEVRMTLKRPAGAAVPAERISRTTIVGTFDLRGG
jgi:hypothetical protein